MDSHNVDIPQNIRFEIVKDEPMTEEEAVSIGQDFVSVDISSPLRRAVEVIKFIRGHDLNASKEEPLKRSVYVMQILESILKLKRETHVEVYPHIGGATVVTFNHFRYKPRMGQICLPNLLRILRNVYNTTLTCIREHEQEVSKDRLRYCRYAFGSGIVRNKLVKVDNKAMQFFYQQLFDNAFAMVTWNWYVMRPDGLFVLKVLHHVRGVTEKECLEMGYFLRTQKIHTLRKFLYTSDSEQADSQERYIWTSIDIVEIISFCRKNIFNSIGRQSMLEAILHIHFWMQHTRNSIGKEVNLIPEESGVTIRTTNQFFDKPPFTLGGDDKLLLLNKIYNYLIIEILKGEEENSANRLHIRHTYKISLVTVKCSTGVCKLMRFRYKQWYRGVHFALKWDWHFMCSDGENVIEIMYHLKNCTENDCKIIKPLIEMMSNSKENNESCMEPPYVEQGDS